MGGMGDSGPTVFDPPRAIPTTHTGRPFPQFWLNIIVVLTFGGNGYSSGSSSSIALMVKDLCGVILPIK